MGFGNETAAAAAPAAPKTKSTTPKGVLTLKSIGPGFDKSSVSGGLTNTIKAKRGRANGSLQLTNKTLGDVTSLADVVGTIEYKTSDAVTLNGKYEAGPRKYQLGGTWNGTVSDRSTSLKLWITNKNNLVNGEVTVGKQEKLNMTFTQKELLTAKYTVVNGKNTIEPSYNFGREAPALAVTRKLGKKDSLKATYDVKAKSSTLEWARNPLKVNISTAVTGNGLTKPTLSATYENVFEF